MSGGKGVYVLGVYVLGVSVWGVHVQGVLSCHQMALINIPSPQPSSRIGPITVRGYPYIYRKYQLAPIMIQGSEAIMNIENKRNAYYIKMNMKQNY